MPILRSNATIDVSNKGNISVAQPENNMASKRFNLREKHLYDCKKSRNSFHMPAPRSQNANNFNKKGNQNNSAKNKEVSKENKNKHDSKQKRVKQICLSENKSNLVLRSRNFQKELLDDLKVTEVKSNNQKHLTINLRKKMSCLKEGINTKKSKIELMTDKKLLQKFSLEEVSIKKNVKTIPVYKNILNLTKCNPIKNQTKEDIYDIAKDEDMSCEVIIKKKKIKPMKRNVIKKKCCAVLENNKENSNKSIFPKSVSNEMKISLNNGQNLLPPSDFVQDTHQLAINKGDTEICSKSPIAEHDIEIISAEPMELDDPSTENSVDNIMFISQLADELEKSLILPKMTSTPGQIKTILPKNVSELKDVSYILTMNVKEQAIVKTPCNSMLKDNVDKNITLFDSPTKEKKKIKKKHVIGLKSSKKFIQMNFLDDFSEPPSNFEKLEESVLKPTKAYHTPDNFKVHLVRAKRKVVDAEKNAIKSKQTIFIEKMTQHFDEISSTELCIE